LFQGKEVRLSEVDIRAIRARAERVHELVRERPLSLVELFGLMSVERFGRSDEEVEIRSSARVAPSAPQPHKAILG
jgi:hypothetical protein